MKRPNNYYGDNFRWFIGRVINNKDPLALGRVQVRIYGIHSPEVDDIPNKDLPWAQVLVPTTEGGVSGLGRMPRIQNGAQVTGFFFDGETSQIPFVLGSIHTIETNTVTGGEPSIVSGSEVINSISSPPQERNFNSSRSYPKYTYSSPGSTELLGGSNGEKIYNFFVANGFTPVQACGIIGNFAAESNLNPAALNPNDVGKPAFGLAQWRATRYAELKAFSAENNLDYNSLSTQCEFTLYELNKYPYLGYAKLKTANTLSESTSIFEKKFERPRPGTFEKRYNFARQAFEEYSA